MKQILGSHFNSSTPITWFLIKIQVNIFQGYLNITTAKVEGYNLYLYVDFKDEFSSSFQWEPLFFTPESSEKRENCN